MKRGKPHMPRDCPVARAINRKLKRSYLAVANGGCADIVRLAAYYEGLEDKTEFLARLPGEVGDFIINFDSGVSSKKPFDFEVELPTKVLREDGK